MKNTAQQIRLAQSSPLLLQAPISSPLPRMAEDSRKARRKSRQRACSAPSAPCPPAATGITASIAPTSATAGTSAMQRASRAQAGGEEDAALSTKQPTTLRRRKIRPRNVRSATRAPNFLLPQAAADPEYGRRRHTRGCSRHRPAHGRLRQHAIVRYRIALAGRFRGEFVKPIRSSAADDPAASPQTNATSAPQPAAARSPSPPRTPPSAKPSNSTPMLLIVMAGALAFGDRRDAAMHLRVAIANRRRGQMSVTITPPVARSAPDIDRPSLPKNRFCREEPVPKSAAPDDPRLRVLQRTPAADRGNAARLRKRGANA